MSQVEPGRFKLSLIKSNPERFEIDRVVFGIHIFDMYLIKMLEIKEFQYLNTG